MKRDIISTKKQIEESPSEVEESENMSPRSNEYFPELEDELMQWQTFGMI